MGPMGNEPTAAPLPIFIVMTKAQLNSLFNSSNMSMNQATTTTTCFVNFVALNALPITFNGVSYEHENNGNLTHFIHLHLLSKYEVKMSVNFMIYSRKKYPSQPVAHQSHTELQCTWLTVILEPSNLLSPLRLVLIFQTQRTLALSHIGHNDQFYCDNVQQNMQSILGYSFMYLSEVFQLLSQIPTMLRYRPLALDPSHCE